MSIKLHPNTKVLVLDAEGQQVGEMKSSEAQDMASAQGLDLVPISEQGSFVVCKIMDYGKFRYHKSKKQKQQTKKIPATKELKFHINTAQHDTDTKTNHAIKFLKKGHPVKLSVVMKGRDKGHVDLAKEKMNAIITTLEDHGKSDSVSVSMSDRSMIVSTVVQPIRINDVKIEGQ